MKTGKHKILKIALAALIVLILATAVGGWCVFGTQLKAVGTIEKLEEHLYAMEYRGDYGFDGFLAQGGAESDGEYAAAAPTFLSEPLILSIIRMSCFAAGGACFLPVLVLKAFRLG